ncbi:unnamed protein product, partial [Iphiclides podalirius]
MSGISLFLFFEGSKSTALLSPGNVLRLARDRKTVGHSNGVGLCGGGAAPIVEWAALASQPAAVLAFATTCRQIDGWPLQRRSDHFRHSDRVVRRQRVGIGGACESSL